MLLLLPSRDKRNLFVGDKKLLSESHRRHFNYALIKLMDDFLFGVPVRILACKKIVVQTFVASWASGF